jgi:hypothetical protein
MLIGFPPEAAWAVMMMSPPNGLARRLHAPAWENL